MHDLLRTGRYDQILGYSSVLLEKDPQNLHAIKYKAYALYFLGRYDEAILYYNKAIQIEPKSPSNYAGKSKALEKLGRIGEARHCYNLAKEMAGETSNLGHNKNEFGK